MKTYDSGKCYDSEGFLTKAGVQVVIDSDRVVIGDSAYPIDDVSIDYESRTIESPNGWSVSL